MMTTRKVATSKTAITGLLLSTITAILGFITQKIFIDYLGLEYSGVNALFTNIVTILTLADLGIGTAAIFHLYSPLANQQKSTIAAVMQYYHKACLIIGSVIIGGSLVLLPFLPIIVGEISIDVNLSFAFILFAINASLAYFFNYKRVILLADQREYIVNRITIICVVVSYLARIGILLATNNYYLFIVISILSKFLENLLVNHIVNKKYPYIFEKNKLSANIKKDIGKRLYAAIYHNSAAYVVNSTDNILIANIFSIIEVGLYSNYFMIINHLSVIFEKIFAAATASLGNVYAKNGSDGLYHTTRNLIFLNSFLSTFAAVALYFCATPFIKVWLGDDYLLGNITLLALVVNFYVRNTRLPVNSSLSAAGVLYENRFVPVAEALINLIASIILAKIIGLPGIFVGTIFSNLFVQLYGYPKYAYRFIFKHKKREYIILVFRNLLVFATTFLLTGAILNSLSFPNNIINFLVSGVISFVIVATIYLILFHGTPEFQYFKTILKRK